MAVNSDSEPELVFLSPEESPVNKRTDQEDQGASPKLRRSSRKRKSIVSLGDSMSKGSSSKIEEKVVTQQEP